MTAYYVRASRLTVPVDRFRRLLMPLTGHADQRPKQSVACGAHEVDRI